MYVLNLCLVETTFLCPRAVVVNKMEGIFYAQETYILMEEGKTIKTHKEHIL